MKFQRGYHI